MKILIGLLIFSLGLVASGLFPPKIETKYQTITETIYKESPVVTQTIYQDRFLTQIKQFQTKEQFYAWYLSVNSEMFAQSNPDWLCADYAWWMVKRATNDGWLLSYCQIWNDAYNSIFKWNKFAKLDGSHAVVSTPINGYTCLLEPQNGEMYPK
jgi:hypothetical protein